jgi:hypothetical protein
MGDPRASLLVAFLDNTGHKSRHEVLSGLLSEVAAAAESGGGVEEAVLSAVAKKSRTSSWYAKTR